MNVKEEFNLAKRLVVEEGYITEMIIEHFVQRNIYHTIAVYFLSSIFDYSLDFSKELIYSHNYYSNNKNEVNPFNEEYLGNEEE
jgi:hypothetical protein